MNYDVHETRERMKPAEKMPFAQEAIKFGERLLGINFTDFDRASFCFSRDNNSRRENLRCNPKERVAN